MRDPVDHYKGVVASAYDLLVPADELNDRAFFQEAIRDHGEPALEVGSGTGRLLIPFRVEGLDVEGVDLSPEMNALCQEKAAAAGVTVELYKQAMQMIVLPRRYRTVYVPAGSFMLLVEDDEIRTCLSRFHLHMESGGRIWITLFMPEKTHTGIAPQKRGRWRLRREGEKGGETIRCWEKTGYDSGKQWQKSEFRYEVLRDGTMVDFEEHTHILRWHDTSQIEKF
ncbi:MAG: methyltransferase domain-containing protein, partial [Planctomycetota bacterium]